MQRITRKTTPTTVAAAVSMAISTSLLPQAASAVTYTFNWDGYFTMLDSSGGLIGNTSIPAPTAKNPSNQFQTPISGTLTYDDVALTGSMTINDFDFFAGTSPAQAQAVTLEFIGDGVCTNDDPAQGCGIGTQMLSNMLFNWNGNNGIPVSIVFDASGMLTYLAGTPTVGDVVTGTGATPASDGIYVGPNPNIQNPNLGNGPGGYPGYIALGPVPVASTAWNTTFAAGCTLGVDSDFSTNTGGGCMSVNPSGMLPLITDTDDAGPDYTANTGGTIGGMPMVDGPFQGSSANFDITNMTLVSDGSGPAFTTPANIVTSVAETATPTTTTIDIGTVADEPGGTTVEYSLDGGTTWIADTGGVNNVLYNLNETVNTFTVDWRVFETAAPASISLGAQSVEITIADTTPPAFTTFPADVTVSVNSTADTVTFEGPTSGAGSVSASDATDPAPLIEWSLDNLNWTTETPGVDESSGSFGPNANTVYWRVTDATGNSLTATQTVTLNIPTGVVGQPCVVDPDLFTNDIVRQLDGTFTMRDSQNALVGEGPDDQVFGTINASQTCPDETCTVSGATLGSPKPFFGNTWSTSGIRLFDQPGTYTFETCLADGSSNCSGPTPLSMTVGAGQLGAHMLFDWSINTNIDVVLVWNFDCGSAQMVSSDPDGDGIIGTRMADGPFSGMNAAFDVSATGASPAITTGGFTVTVPVVKNAVANTSPPVLAPGPTGTALTGEVTISEADLLTTFGAAADSAVERSCAGGCFDFVETGRTTGETIQVVFPLSEPIPFYSLYRKYDVATDSWRTFTTTMTDRVETAQLTMGGACPEPGSGDYSSETSGVLPGMLRPGDQCVQLTITDNGPNDSDPANGTIADPGGVGVTSGPSAPSAGTSGGGCTVASGVATQPPASRLDLWLLAGLLAMLGLRKRRPGQQQ